MGQRRVHGEYCLDLSTIRGNMILLLPLIVFQCAIISAGDPESFANYFDDSLKGVDIPQDAAIEACVQKGNGLAQKVDGAYDKCFGNDYDFDDLAAAAGGSVKDSDGLPDSFEGNEICFYKQMGWVDASGEASAEAIKADLAGLDDDLKDSFDASIDECAAWSGNFGARMKREADVPSVMGFGGKALNWLKSMRKKREAAGKDEKKPGKKEEAKKGGKGKKKAGKRKAKESRQEKSGQEESWQEKSGQEESWQEESWQEESRQEEIRQEERWKEESWQEESRQKESRQEESWQG